jgi:hypothetical protein
MDYIEFCEAPSDNSSIRQHLKKELKKDIEEFLED